MSRRTVLVAPVLIGVLFMITGCAHRGVATDPTTAQVRSPTARPATDPATDQPRPFPGDLPSGQPRGLTAGQRRVDRTSPDAVAVAFVLRLELVDSRLDRRPNDAARRAAAYATPKLRRRLLSLEPVGAAGARWAALVDHRGWTTVRTEVGGLGENPPTTTTRAVRAVTPVAMDHGTDGWSSPPDSPGTYVVVLERMGRDQPWAVGSYTIQ